MSLISVHLNYTNLKLEVDQGFITLEGRKRRYYRGKKGSQYSFESRKESSSSVTIIKQSLPRLK